jgi:ribonuclease-3 family protein
VKPFQFEHGALPGSLELAYLGDTVYDLYVRARLLRAGGHVRDMHRRAVGLVCAHAQAEAFARVEPHLTEGEREVARRARNARQTPAKNADAKEYHRATALEALTGYLFVTGQTERMEQLLEIALEEDDEKR